MNKKILIVTTNYGGCDCEKTECDCIADTGVWLDEFAIPYIIFKNKEFDITIASPNGGNAPIDKKSLTHSDSKQWIECIEILKNTEKLSDVASADFDGIFLPGGHGPMFDLANNKELAKIIEKFKKEDKVISAICHGPAGLTLAKNDDGTSILNKKRVTSFTNKEEGLSESAKFVPFLLETKIKELGGNFIEKAPTEEHVEVDGKLLTGQNPRSSRLLAEKILEVI